MTVAAKTIKTEIQLPVDILYSLGIDKTRIEYFVKKNFLLELYREGRMAALLEVSRTEMLGIMKDSKIPLNYGVSELDDDIETAKRMGILNESSQ
jgi:predicted HTH domain antitoxin